MHNRFWNWIAQRRVARGVALLDNKYPGWFEKMNLQRFDLTNEYLCVCGQLYGNYKRGCLLLEIKPLRDGIRRGFATGISIKQYRRQEMIWRRIIDDRQDAMFDVRYADWERKLSRQAEISNDDTNKKERHLSLV